MENTKIIEAIRKEAKENKVADAFFHVCALRERARSQITVSGMSQRMKKQGFSFSKTDYEKLLKFLGGLGLGRIQNDSKGRAVALKDVKVSLQSLGVCAVGNAQKLINVKQRNRFEFLNVPLREVSKPLPKATGAVAGTPVSITFVINGKPVDLKVPQELTEIDIAEIIRRVRNDSGGNSEGLKI